MSDRIQAKIQYQYAKAVYVEGGIVFIRVLQTKMIKNH